MIRMDKTWKLEDLMQKRHLPNYLNYTKEDYNILTLQKHSGYYKALHQLVPSYIREQPDWNKSYYKKKKTKITQFNYIMFRNVKNLKKIKGKSWGYRNDQLNKTHCAKWLSQDTKSRTAEMQKRSLSLYCKARNNRGLSAIKTDIVQTNNKPKHNPILSKKERLIIRAQQLTDFIKDIKTEKAKKILKRYGHKLVEKLKLKNITKEHVKTAMANISEEFEDTVKDTLNLTAIDINKNNKEDLQHETNINPDEKEKEENKDKDKDKDKDNDKSKDDDKIKGKEKEKEREREKEKEKEDKVQQSKE